MSNINIRSSAPVQAIPSKPVAQSTPAPAAKEAAQAPGLSRDTMTWSSASKGSKIKAAATEVFKETALTYTVVGAAAPVVAGATLGALIGFFNGNPLGFAKEGAKAAARYAPAGAALGLGVSGVQSGVMGTVVGTSPDKASAMTRMGTLTAVVGILTAEDGWDLAGTAAETAHNSIMAGRIFEKAEARIEAGN